MTSRLLKLATLDNLRDYGDYATAAGGRVRPGRLFRSGHHGRLDDADLERLAALGLGKLPPGQHGAHGPHFTGLAVSQRCWFKTLA